MRERERKRGKQGKRERERRGERQGKSRDRKRRERGEREKVRGKKEKRERERERERGVISQRRRGRKTFTKKYVIHFNTRAYVYAFSVSALQVYRMSGQFQWKIAFQSHCSAGNPIKSILP